MNAKIKPMIQFIELEAREKVQEIEEKSVIECQAVRAKIVEEEEVSIEKDYEREVKNYDLGERIKYSKAESAAMIKVMEEKQNLMMELLKDTRMKINELAKTNQYAPFLEKLVLQGMLYMNEPFLYVRYRQEDSAHFSDAKLKEWETKYEQLTSKKCELKLDTERFLMKGPDGSEKSSCCGGVVLITKNMHISCDNTFDERLRKAYAQQLPVLKKKMFA